MNKLHHHLSMGLLLATIISFSFYFTGPEGRSIPDPYQGITLCFGGADFQYIASRDTNSPMAPRLDGLGDLHFEVSTESEDAQYFFDQGMRLVYAFNHAEAHRAFQEAARLDPNLAMAYWGQALALGPNINDPFPDAQRQQAAHEAINKAAKIARHSSQMEQDLIDAMTQRCTDAETWDQHALNVAYFEAMEEMYPRYEDNPDVGTLYGASIMNTMPWNYYENGKPRTNTAECVAALKKVIDEHPGHPGGHHYFIHIIEATDPHQAIPSADALCDLMPEAGHIVHMPSHIYLAVGMYDKAAEQNRQAIDADQDYIAQCQAQGMYPLAYYPHNIHFLWASASMLGNSEEAIDAAEKVADKVPSYLGADLPFIQDFMSVPVQAFVRFGKWNEILTTPAPPENMIHARMMWHYARGIAWVRKSQPEKAEAELNMAAKYGKMEEAKTLLAAYNNPTSEVAKVALNHLAGEIAAAMGDYPEAMAHLKKAVEAEDALVYQEPSAWHAPVRQYLGAQLLEAGKVAEAEEVYRMDLKKHPHNGWSLYGLARSLEKQGRKDEAANVRKDFKKAWAHADVELEASRF